MKIAEHTHRDLMRARHATVRARDRVEALQEALPRVAPQQRSRHQRRTHAAVCALQEALELELELQRRDSWWYQALRQNKLTRRRRLRLVDTMFMLFVDALAQRPPSMSEDEWRRFREKAVN